MNAALVENGHTAGWGLYCLFAPSGESQPYAFAAVDMLNRIGPIPMEETVEQVCPGMGIEEIIEKAEAARTVVDSETWALIASTTAATHPE